MMKKQQLAYDGWVLTVEYPTIKKSLSVDISTFGQEVKDFGLKHGFKQLFGDAASGSTPAEKYEMAKRKLEAFKAGQTTLSGERDTSAIVILAVANLKKLKLAAVEKIAEAKPEKIADWRSNIQVKAEIARIRAERAAANAEEADEVEIDL